MQRTDTQELVLALCIVALFAFQFAVLSGLSHGGWIDRRYRGWKVLRKVRREGEGNGE